MKRSRRVVLTMMGTAAIGAVTMGFVPRSNCGPVSPSQRDPHSRPAGNCNVTYGGFGYNPDRGHGHGHGHGHGG